MTPGVPQELFIADPGVNLLPSDGVVRYYGPILSPQDAQRSFAVLRDQAAWRNDEAVIFGRRIVTARMAAWYGDQPYAYAYSGTTKTALPWLPELRALKATVEQRSGAAYNSCLLNLYHDGSEGMGWHSDDEKSLAPGSAIASVSLGAERKFSLRHKRTGETVSLVLAHGSLLVMEWATQANWLHCVPKTRKVPGARINLTFRKMNEAGEFRNAP